MLTAKEVYNLACMWHRAFKNGRVTEAQYKRAEDIFYRCGCAAEWKASYGLYFTSIVWLGV